MAIQSFAERSTQRFFTYGILPRKVGWVIANKVVRKKLDIIHYAAKLSDLKAPPGICLESLKDIFPGFYSIRLNSQWRIVFRWAHTGAADVQVTDYHLRS
jgi:proteic killer suppression protein